MTDTHPLAPTDAEIENLGHRMCWRYKHSTDPNHSSTYTFNRLTLLDFARAVLAKWGVQPVPAGYAMVPVEPTPEMLAEVDEEVGGHCYSCTRWKASHDDCQRIWVAMLAAAPQPVEREPLTDEQIESLLWKYGYDPDDTQMAAMLKEARGIKGGQHGAE